MNRLEAKKEVLRVIKLIDIFGWTDSIYTHVSYQIEDGWYYTNAMGKEFSEMTMDDIIMVDYDGNILESTKESNTAGTIIHGIAHKLRPDMKFIIHTHSTDGIAFSCTREQLLPLNQMSCKFYNRLGYHAYEGIVLDRDEEMRIAESLGVHKHLVLENHGLIVSGETPAETFNSLYMLERAVEIQNKLMAMGKNNLNLLDAEVAEKTALQFESFKTQGAMEYNAWLNKYNLNDI